MEILRTRKIRGWLRTAEEKQNHLRRIWDTLNLKRGRFVFDFLTFCESSNLSAPQTHNWDAETLIGQKIIGNRFKLESSSSTLSMNAHQKSFLVERLFMRECATLESSHDLAELSQSWKLLTNERSEFIAILRADIQMMEKAWSNDFWRHRIILIISQKQNAENLQIQESNSPADRNLASKRSKVFFR